MIERLELFFPGPVRSKERARAAGRGRFAGMYTPQETVDAEKAIRARLIEWKRSAGWEESWNGPIHLRLYALYPASDTKPAGAEHIYSPDTDNIVKTFMDAAQDKALYKRRKDKTKYKVCVEGIMTNDCRVSSLYVRKVYSNFPAGALLVVEFHKPQFKLSKTRRISPIDSDTVKPLEFDWKTNGGAVIGESTTPETDQAEDEVEDFREAEVY